MTDDLQHTAERISLRADDGHRVLVDFWRPAEPRRFLHLFHGLGEHPARYERFARHCNAHGIAVAAHSHRGHGEACSLEDLGHFADSDGWDLVLRDAAMVQRHVAGLLPGLPLVLVGHSMGSFIAQSFVARGLGRPDAMILSGSNHAPRGQLLPGRWLSGVIRLAGRRRKSGLLNALGFSAFNKRFEPARTGFDWLSRDETEVDRYVSDPLCGALSSSQLWFDLTGGLLEVTSPGALRRVPADMPLLITGGADDPVGGREGMQRLAEAYRGAGHQRVSVSIYEDARHEMFNETNREQFYVDVTDWLERSLS